MSHRKGLPYSLAGGVIGSAQQSKGTRAGRRRQPFFKEGELGEEGEYVLVGLIYLAPCGALWRVNLGAMAVAAHSPPLREALSRFRDPECCPACPSPLPDVSFPHGPHGMYFIPHQSEVYP